MGAHYPTEKTVDPSFSHDFKEKCGNFLSGT